MKKNVLLIILGVATVFCIIFGTIRHTGRGFRALRDSGFISIGDDWDWDYDCDDEDDEEEEDVAEAKSVSKKTINQTLESFSSIKMDITVMDLTIEEGPDFKLECYFNKEYLRPSFSVKHNTLEVTQTKHRVYGINIGNNSCRMVITIPSGTDLNSIIINSNVGDIKLRDLVSEEIDLTVNVGELYVNKVAFDDISCKTNVGEVNIRQTGNLNDYNINVTADVGEVSVDGRSYKHHYNSKVNSSKKIRVSTNVGEISIR